MITTRHFVDQPLTLNQQVKIPTKVMHHLVRVMKRTSGDAVLLFNGDGYDYAGRLHSENKHSAASIFIEERIDRSECEPNLTIQIGLPVSKGQRTDFALQKLVELGVTEITPLITERTVVRIPPERRSTRIQHWRQVIISASEQCGRARLTGLHSLSTLENWCNHLETSNRFVLSSKAQQSFTAIEAPRNPAVALVFGPEGGLSMEELELLEGKDFQPVRLGRRILRSETTPIACVAAIQALWGDFSIV